MAKLEAQKSKPQRKWEEGKEYLCILSKSPGYKLGRKYKCYKNEDGFSCLMGDDGFEDLCSMLVSGFSIVNEKGNSKNA